jgi:hypothetical protein
MGSSGIPANNARWRMPGLWEYADLPGQPLAENGLLMCLKQAVDGTLRTWRKPVNHITMSIARRFFREARHEKQRTAKIRF